MDSPDKRKSTAARPKKTVKKKKEASPAREASVFQKYRLLIFRLAAASVLYAFALIGKLSPVLNTLVFVACAILAGYDILLEAVRFLRWGRFFSEPVILILVTAVSFIIGFKAEGAALLILYQAMKLLVFFVSDKTLFNSLGLIKGKEEELRTLAEEQLKDEDSSVLKIAAVLDRTITPVLLAAAGIAILYALLLSLAFHYNIRVSIHRAITILLICTPYSVLVSMPLIGKVSLCFSASNGTVFKRASDLEAIDGTSTVIIDKKCFPDAETEDTAIVSYTSTNLDDSTFFTLIRHLLNDSNQDFAKRILQKTSSQYIPGLVSDFSEAPGGVKALINGTQGVFGTRSYLTEAGLAVPEISEDQGIYYYLFLGGRYGGYVVLSENSQNDVSDIVHYLRVVGIHKCILICSEIAEEVSEFSRNSDFDEVYAGIDTLVKADVVDELCSSDNQKKVYVRVDDALRRSMASVEIRTGKELSDSDALNFPDYYTSIPFLFSLSRRIDEIAIENAVLAFAVKIILIFFGLIGFCNLWVAVTADMAAAVLTILNANRVTVKSLRRTFLNK